MNIIKLFSVSFMICLFTSMAYGQSKQVTGIVKDAKGTLPGATVIEKDLPGNGTVTDIDGKFKITLKGKSNTIVVSSVGYVPSEIKVTTASITVVLEDNSKALEEVVVVGYAPVKKVTLTGAVSAVSGAELRANPSPSLQNTLTGKVTGYFSQQRSGAPGADGAGFVIRGVSSLTSDNQPLIIVDDVQFTYEQFARLDANEVESVSVLKDASTTAIYGVKGANGVILVTTRRGSVGKPQITVRSEYSLAQPTILPEYLDSYHAALLYNQAQLNDYNNLIPAATTPFVPRFSSSDLALYQNGQDPYGHPNVNWKDAIYKKFSTQQRDNLDISGGTEKLKYFVSLGYLNQGGITKDYSSNTGVNNNFYYNRYNYRSNMDIEVNKTLKFRFDIFGSVGERNTPYIADGTDPFFDYSAYLYTSPYSYPIKNPDGSWGYSQNQQTNTPGLNNLIGRMTLDGYNRVFESNINLATSAVQDLKFITKGLSLKGTLAYASSYSWGRNETRTNFPSFIYDPVANTYTPRDANIYKIDKFGLTYTPGSTVRQLTTQAFLNYDRTFGDNHFTGLVLFSRTSLTQYVDASTNPPPPPTGTNPDQTYNFIPSNSQGLTSRLSYDYKQKYIVTLSGAYNGTDRFTADKRFGLFPAVSAAWNVAEEHIVKDNLKFLDQLKLRASYGLVGSDRIGNNFTYAYLQTYSPYSGNGVASGSFGTNNNSTTGLQEGTLPNSNITWEKQRELDLGIDFAIFNSKLTGLVDYFKNDRYDILINRGSVSTIFGQNTPPVNLGRTNNRGLEIELGYRDKIGKDFTYGFKGTFSYAKNQIVYNDFPAVPYDYQNSIGTSIGTAYEYIWTGRYYKNFADIAATPHPTGTHPGDLVYADLNHDGKIDGNDERFAGNPNLPEKNYGLNLNFGYKGFSVSALFQAATDFSVSAFSESIRPFTANFQPIHQQAWTPDLGDNAKYPALTLGPNNSDQGSAYPSSFFNVSGNYLRLKTAELRYTFPSPWMNKLHIHGASIYMNGYNLLTWAKSQSLYQIDPEANTFLKSVTYPPSKTYNLGLSVTF